MVIVLAALLMPSVAVSQQPQKRSGKRAVSSPFPAAAGIPAEYRSKNFVLHTDLSKAEAQALLKRKETMLAQVTKYWGRPNPRPIVCIVAKNINDWPEAVVNRLDRRGVDMIRARGGLCISKPVGTGVSYHINATVYATAEKNVPFHEAIHAYCRHAFGNVGPIWYAEGMAEVGHYWRENDSAVAVHCPQYIAKYLRGSEPKTLRAIVNDQQYNAADVGGWQHYAWRWALCHLLGTNTNYRKRFRPLGLGFLTKQKISFESVYGPMAREISFEYLFFLKHVEPGYRVDLCSWDWKTPFSGLSHNVGGQRHTAATSRIKARCGWQASRLLVKNGQKYECSTKGQWKTSKKGASINADGSKDGTGRLVGILFDDSFDYYVLSKPFELGAKGTFQAPDDGKLFLRCRDRWSEIADNSGRITVRIKAD